MTTRQSSRNTVHRLFSCAISVPNRIGLAPVARGILHYSLPNELHTQTIRFVMVSGRRVVQNPPSHRGKPGGVGEDQRFS